MSSLVQIRNVPTETRQRIKAKAAARGESLNTFLLKMLDREASRPTAAEVFERAARRSEQLNISTVELLDETRSEREENLAQGSLG